MISLQSESHQQLHNHNLNHNDFDLDRSNSGSSFDLKSDVSSSNLSHFKGAESREGFFFFSSFQL